LWVLTALSVIGLVVLGAAIIAVGDTIPMGIKSAKETAITLVFIFMSELCDMN
jgi:hypothetical protein